MHTVRQAHSLRLRSKSHIKYKIDFAHKIILIYCTSGQCEADNVMPDRTLIKRSYKMIPVKSNIAQAESNGSKLNRIAPKKTISCQFCWIRSIFLGEITGVLCWCHANLSVLNLWLVCALCTAHDPNTIHRMNRMIVAFVQFHFVFVKTAMLKFGIIRWTINIVHTHTQIGIMCECVMILTRTHKNHWFLLAEEISPNAIWRVQQWSATIAACNECAKRQWRKRSIFRLLFHFNATIEMVHGTHTHIKHIHNIYAFWHL